ncbi:MAG TPA: threonine ammonia-lyase [Acidimicrobiales bacterium]|nr:threonine ammonia-lyase [Acidimicrobiales bacterium]
MINLGDVEAARKRVAPILRPTPVRLSNSLSQLTGRRILLKPEYEQRTGSFKIRGAYNRIAQLPPGVDVVAASAGNHAQGVALAATETGRHATIFMPDSASLPKVNATRGYGATVRLEGDAVDDCIRMAKAWAAEHGAVYVPPFDDPAVIAGQGTVGLEIADEAPEAQVVVVPAGGGGLLSGVATALAGCRRSIRVVGVEAAGAPTIAEAVKVGHPVTLPTLATMADGIAVRATSELIIEHVQAFVDDVVTVDEEEISHAMLLAVERAKAVVEPSGAVALAALLAGKVPGLGPAVAILSGGNVDPLLLTKLIEHGLAAAGRYLSLRIVTADRPGALAALTTELARLGLNVLDVVHHRSSRALHVAEVEVQVTVETTDEAQHAAVVSSLEAAGYRVRPVA